MMKLILKKATECHICNKQYTSDDIREIIAILQEDSEDQVIKNVIYSSV